MSTQKIISETIIARIPRGDAFYAAATFLAVIGLWQLATQALSIPSYLLPSPLAIMNDLRTHWPIILLHTWFTAFEVLVGFAISTLVGIPLAVALTYSRTFDKSVYPLIVGSQVVPKIAVAPMLLAWFGFGMFPKIVIVVLVAFFPIVINTVVGLRSSPIEMSRLASSMGATAAQTFWKFRLPNALPNIFAGLKMATILAVIGATVAEFVGADKGVGYLIMIAGSDFNIERQFSAVLALSALAVVFYWLTDCAEKVFIPWHVSVRSNK